MIQGDEIMVMTVTVAHNIVTVFAQNRHSLCVPCEYRLLLTMTTPAPRNFTQNGDKWSGVYTVYKGLYILETLCFLLADC